ncbi:SGNH/GDSL hydrolase family protein [Myceligenerans halotolerans]
MPSTARLVFVGDSITDADRDRADTASLGDGYVSLIAKEVADDVVVNLGIGGDRAVDLERRWADDVEPAAADVLTVYVGVNDTWRRFDSDDPTSAADFEATYRRLVARTDGARLILMEPFVLPVHDAQRDWLEDLDAKRAAVARIARDTGAGLVPLHRILTEAAGQDPERLAPDGVHPTLAGSRLIADNWLEAYRGA